MFYFVIAIKLFKNIYIPTTNQKRLKWSNTAYVNKTEKLYSQHKKKRIEISPHGQINTRRHFKKHEKVGYLGI